MKKLNWTWIIITQLITVALLISSCGKDKGEAAKSETYKVERKNLSDVLTQTGEVRSVTKVEIRSEASGRVEEILVREGQMVEAGDTILTVDAERLGYQRDKLQLAVRKAKINWETAKRNLENAKNLIESGAVSQRRLQDLKDEAEVAGINYQQQLLELKDIVNQMQKTSVTSPMNGVLTQLDVEEGEIVVSATGSFQSGTIIGTIADISDLEIISKVGEADYGSLDSGQKVEIRPQAREDVSTTGTIEFLSLTAKKEKEGELGTFEIRISVDSLVPGMVPGINVNVDFVILEVKDVLAVPFHYIRKGPRGSVVFKKSGDEKEAESVPVELGRTDYRFFEITSGVSEGDVLVPPPKPTEDKPKHGGYGH